MQNEIVEAIELLNLWKDFKENSSGDLTEFGLWLDEKLKKQIKSNTSAEFDKVEDVYFESQDVKNLVLDTKINVLLGKLENYSHLLTKKALADLPIKSTEEFVLLIFLQFYPNLKKTDFIKRTLMETTTAFEMIKRLVKQGLVEDTESETDKRAKTMQLTKAGLEVLEKAKIEMNKVTKLSLGNLSGNDKKKLEEILNYLDAFHQHIHETQKDDSLDKILEKNILSKKNV